MTDHPNTPQERASWIGVNSYGVFVALLVILIAIRHAIEPQGLLLSAAGHVGYALAGIGLLHSYWRANVVTEVFASVLLVGSNLTILAARYLFFDRPSVFEGLVSVALLVAVIARTLALIRGGTIVLPPWRRHEEGR